MNKHIAEDSTLQGEWSTVRQSRRFVQDHVAWFHRDIFADTCKARQKPIKKSSRTEVPTSNPTLVVDNLQRPILFDAFLIELKDGGNDVCRNNVNVGSQLVARVVPKHHLLSTPLRDTKLSGENILANAINGVELELALRHSRPLGQNRFDVLIGQAITNPTVMIQLHHGHLCRKLARTTSFESTPNMTE